MSTSDLDTEVRGTYTITDNGASSPIAAIQPRLDTTSGKRLAVFFETSQARLREYDGSSWSTLDTNSSAGSSLDTAYAYRIISDGTDVEVWHGTPGAQMTKILETSSAATDLSSNTSIRFMVSPGAVVQYDDVMILASGLSRTSTFSVANNNELSSASDYNGTTSYTYDSWGRMSTESKNGVTRTYSWAMANQLAGVNSSDPNETDVAYWYTGDLRRIWRFEDGVLANSYKWDAGFNVDEETYWDGGSPTGTKAYAAGLAEVDVTSTPSYSYITWDHLGSTRGLWDGNKNQLGSWEYTPYGSPYLFGGPSDVTHLFAGLEFDVVTRQYYSLLRSLDPGLGRWLKQDPLGMVDGPNIHVYAKLNPLRFTDPFGLDASEDENSDESAGPGIIERCFKGITKWIAKFFKDSAKDPSTTPITTLSKPTNVGVKAPVLSLGEGLIKLSAPFARAFGDSVSAAYHMYDMEDQAGKKESPALSTPKKYGFDPDDHLFDDVLYDPDN